MLSRMVVRGVRTLFPLTYTSGSLMNLSPSCLSSSLAKASRAVPSEGQSSYRAGLDDLLEGQVHPRVAVDEMAVERFAVLELDEHRVALRGVEQAEG